MLVYVENLKNSSPKVLELINEFGVVSEYDIHIQNPVVPKR